VEGAEAVLPHGTVGGEVPADCAEEAGHSGAGGRGVEALEHGLGGAVRGVARGRAVRQEGIDVLVLAPWRRHSASAWIGWWARFADKRNGDGWMVRVGGWKEGDGEEGKKWRGGCLLCFYRRWRADKATPPVPQWGDAGRDTG